MRDKLRSGRRAHINFERQPLDTVTIINIKTYDHSIMESHLSSYAASQSISSNFLIDYFSGAMKSSSKKEDRIHILR